MRLLTAIANISNHKTTFVEQEKFNQAYKNLDGTYLVTFEKIYKNRTGKQNRTVWGLAYKIIKDALIDAWGDEYITDKDVHELCLELCLPHNYVNRLKDEYAMTKGYVNKKTGEIVKKKFDLTSTKMTTVEWMEYYQNLQIYWKESLNITIPDIQSYDAL